jgi:hypothetical protein
VRKTKKKQRRSKSRSVPLSAEMREALKQQTAAFKEKFGRDPGPEDPLFFDPHADTPRPASESAEYLAEVDAAVLQAMQAANIRPELIYAWKRTGFIATEHNWELLTEAQRVEWTAAIEEFEKQTRDPQ